MAGKRFALMHGVSEIFCHFEVQKEGRRMMNKVGETNVPGTLLL